MAKQNETQQAKCGHTGDRPQADRPRPTNLRGEQLGVYITGVGRRGLARAVYVQVRDLVVGGQVPAGTRLPSSRDLAAHLDVSRHTIASAYEQLAAEGYVEGRGGGGTIVSDLRRTPPPVPAQPPAPALTGTTPRFDLRPGSPDLSLFPVDDWRRCVSDAAALPPAGYSDPGGERDVRRELAAWVNRSRGLAVDPDSVIVTSGAQHGIDLALAAVSSPGARVALEDPGYPDVSGICRRLGVEIVPVPVDDAGIVVDAIPPDVTAIVVTPAHQSPLGAVMSMERRLDLLAHARRHGALVIEDDYDSEYRHVARPLEPLHRLDGGGCVAYVHSFSKTLAPSLRLGFLVTPDRFVHAITEHRRLTDRQPPALMQEALQRFIARGHQDRHLRRTRRVYRERHALVSLRIDEWIDAGLLASTYATSAGLHVAATLPEGVDEGAVLARLERRGVAIDALGPTWLRPPGRPGLVLGFGRIGGAELATALATTGECLRAAINP